MSGSRIALTLIAAATSVLAVGCNSSGGGTPVAGTTTTPPVTTSTTPAGTSTAPENTTTTPASGETSALDPCAIGTWDETGESGTIDLGNGVTVDVSGGAGTVLTVDPDGTASSDFSNADPVSGTGSDGSDYAITTTGTLVGTLTAANGHATITYQQSDGQQTVTKDGQVIDQQTPPAGQSVDSTYTCDDTTLSTTQDGITTNYTRQG